MGFSLRVLYSKLQEQAQPLYRNTLLPTITSYVKPPKPTATNNSPTKRNEIGAFYPTARHLEAHSEPSCVGLAPMVQSKIINESNYVRKLLFLRKRSPTETVGNSAMASLPVVVTGLSSVR